MVAVSMAIELRHLRYFLAVIEELHFGRAAVRLSMRQPPLSQAIRALEDELGVQLLERTSRSVIATQAGLVFAEEARTVLASFDRAIAETRRIGGAGSGLRIGCIPHLPIEQLNRFLDALHRRDAGTPAEVSHLLGLEQVRRLRSGALDLGIFELAEEHAGIQTAPLFAGEPMVAFLAPNHPLAQLDVIGPQHVVNEVLLTYARAVNHAIYDAFLDELDEAGYRFRAIHVIAGQHPRDLLLPVSRDDGILFAPPSFQGIDDAGTTVITRPLDPVLTTPDRVIAWRADAPRELSRVLAAVRETATSLRAESVRPRAGW
jgi:DNA-binding transcriptional LysR family regulator